jgi:hypothetical protein
MKLICTYCAGPKREDGGLLPAVDRYLSERIKRLLGRALAQGAAFRILSGEFGLLSPEHPIPWYDHLLAPEEAPRLAQQVSSMLSDLPVTSVEYHTAEPDRYPDVAPYLEVMETACKLVGMDLGVIILTGNPD